MLTAVVIDDNQEIITKNCSLIKDHCPNITIAGTAGSVASGIKAIEQASPDLVFLDVKIADGDGFHLLEKLRPFTFKVIFVTGCTESAIKAFRFSAVDYLLKPLNATDLKEAVQKAEQSLIKEKPDTRFKHFFTTIGWSGNHQKLTLKTTDKIYSVNIGDIVNCQSEKNYTTFYLINSQKLVVSTNLKEYENLLTPFNFFRTHQSHLINMAYFDYYLRADGGNRVVMKNKSEIPLSVRKKEEFLLLLENMHL